MSVKRGRGGDAGCRRGAEVERILGRRPAHGGDGEAARVGRLDHRDLVAVVSDVEFRWYGHLDPGSQHAERGAGVVAEADVTGARVGRRGPDTENGPPV